MKIKIQNQSENLNRKILRLFIYYDKLSLTTKRTTLEILINCILIIVKSEKIRMEKKFKFEFL